MIKIPAKIKTFSLGRSAVKTVQSAVDDLFDRVKLRVLGPWAIDKRIAISAPAEFTLPGLYVASAMEAGSPKVDESLLKQLLAIPEAYLEAQREVTKARVVHTIDAFLKDAYAGGIKTDLETVMAGELAVLFGKLKSDLTTIINTEAQNCRATGALDGIIAVNNDAGIEDPTVIMSCTHDEFLCQICKELHLLSDGITPKAWKLSEMSHGYRQKGDTAPSMAGEHPNCRCFLRGDLSVVTETGRKQLKDVSIGEMVLTHTGRFRKVVAVLNEGGVPGVPFKDKNGFCSIKFRDPVGKTHSLPVTNDHMMLTQRGWIRAQELVPGQDCLQFLFVVCENCGKKIPYDTNIPNRRFCSRKCSWTDKERLKKNTQRYKEWQESTPPEIKSEWRRRAVVAIKTRARQHPQEVSLVCAGCGCEFVVEWKRRKQFKSCSLSCSAKVRWDNPDFYDKMYTGLVDSARNARQFPGSRGLSKEQRALYELVAVAYPDATYDGPRIGPYFPDIAIASIKTVIEWDGGGHWMSVYKGEKTREQKTQEDNERDNYIRKAGWHVLRYNPQTGTKTVLADLHRVGQNSLGQYSWQGVEIIRVDHFPKWRAGSRARMYDISVEEDESFVILGVASHNCSIITVMPGWGYVGGRTAYIEPGYDLYNDQHGLGKSESDEFEPLEKSFHYNDFIASMKKYGWTFKRDEGDHEMWVHPHIPNGLNIKHEDVKRKMDQGRVDYYLHQVGMRRDQQNQIVPSPKGPFAEAWRRAGHLPPLENEAPKMVTWVPELPHEHVEIGSIEPSKAPEEWSVLRYQKELGGSNTGKLPPIDVMSVDGKDLIASGDALHEAARRLGHTHVPIRRLA